MPTSAGTIGHHQDVSIWFVLPAVAVVAFGVCIFLGIYDIAASIRELKETFNIPFPESYIDDYARFFGLATAAIGAFWILGILFAW